MLKLSDNPPALFPESDDPLQRTGPWWVGHTKARCEKAFAWDLLNRGIGYFLPMVERINFSGQRKRRVLVPLFPSYVFFSGGPEDRQAALLTDRLCRVLPVVDQAATVAELAALHQALEGRASLDPYPFAVVGRRCRVSSGPFQGLEGTLIQRNGASRFVLQVQMLGQGAAMEIDADLLEPLEVTSN